MSLFNFYLEYEGSRSTAQTYKSPSDKIESAGIASAMKCFAQRNKLREVEMERLGHNDYRVYYEEKRLFKQGKEIIYYIKED